MDSREYLGVLFLTLPYMAVGGNLVLGSVCPRLPSPLNHIKHFVTVQ